MPLADTGIGYRYRKLIPTCGCRYRVPFRILRVPNTVTIADTSIRYRYLNGRTIFPCLITLMSPTHYHKTTFTISVFLVIHIYHFRVISKKATFTNSLLIKQRPLLPFQPPNYCICASIFVHILYCHFFHITH